MAEQDEKRHLDQLTPGEPGESAEELSGHDEDTELQTLLRQWRLPRNSRELDQRVLSAYRNQVSGTGRWRRLFFRPVPVPLPIAAALLLALAFLASRIALPPTVVRLEVRTHVPKVVRVEVPVVREKIVTRTVYRQSPEMKNTDKNNQTERARSAADSLNGAPQSSQIALRLADFEPVERIQLRVLSRKGVNP
jgi:hypothetical protein